jgi:5-methyltetrahydrofolate--homocysteine methyltransferase
VLHELQEEVIAAAWFEPKVVYGYFPSQSDGNDVIVYDGDSKTEIQRFTFPRQREGRRLSISDYFLSKLSGKMDVIGMSVVTIGSRASVETQKLFEGGEYTKYLYLHGLSVETAEALAEFMHKRIREELSIAGDDSSRTTCFTRSIAGRAIRLAIRHARILKTRPSCLRCSSPRKILECG